jgi:hypothetical protein
MATTITAQTLLRNADNDTIFVASAGAAFNPGDVTTVGDGRVGVVQGLSAVASGDPMTLRVTGQYDALKNATTDVYAVGAPVWWDPTAKKAKTTYAATYLFLGVCVKASASGDTYVYTDLNTAGGVTSVLPPINVTGASVTVDSTFNNRQIVLDRATGIAVTLPAATGTGARLRFLVKTAISGGSTTITRAGSDTLTAQIFQLKNAAAVATYNSTTATALTMDGSTKGGVAGDLIEFIDIASGVWFVNGTLSASGTVANPLS